MKIYFDMDGTIADLYGVPDWLPMLEAEDPKPYAIAKPLVNMNKLAKALHKAQAAGHEVYIISWLSKYSTSAYGKKVTAAKLQWLKIHLRSVQWDNIHIIEYGINKWDYCGSDDSILFDDEQRNRDQWLNHMAYEPEKIFEILGGLC